MKRELSPTPSPPPPIKSDYSDRSSPKIEPYTTPKKAKSTPIEKSSSKRADAIGHGNGSWTAEKRVELMTDILVAGIAALGTRNLADKYGVSISQMSNALQAGRKGNLRDKAILAVKGEDDWKLDDQKPVEMICGR